MLKKWNWFDYLNVLLMAFIGIVTLYPVLNVVSISFSDSCYIVRNEVSFFPRGLNIDAYQYVLRDGKIPRAIANSILYTTVGVLLNVLFTAVSAYPLSKKDFFGKKYFMIAIVLTMFFNGGMIPNYIIVQRLGLIDTMWALILPNVIWTFQLLIMKSFYQTLPEAIFESAVIDGASEFRILFRIVIPLSKAAIASITLFYFMGQWNSFYNALIYLNSPQKFTLQLVLRNMILMESVDSAQTTIRSNIPQAALKDATIFLAMIPVLLLYPFLQKYFVKGVTLGSIKG